MGPYRSFSGTLYTEVIALHQANIDKPLLLRLIYGKLAHPERSSAFRSSEAGMQHRKAGMYVYE
jgi:hypothetical protein